jgi:hypothetical protein
VDVSGKVHENRLRRAAERQGYRLVKSRRRDPRALDYGTYELVKVRDDARGLDGSLDGLDLDEVEGLLSWRPEAGAL